MIVLFKHNALKKHNIKWLIIGIILYLLDPYNMGCLER